MPGRLRNWHIEWGTVHSIHVCTIRPEDQNKTLAFPQISKLVVIRRLLIAIHCLKAHLIRDILFEGYWSSWHINVFSYFIIDTEWIYWFLRNCLLCRVSLDFMKCFSIVCITSINLVFWKISITWNVFAWLF